MAASWKDGIAKIAGGRRYGAKDANNVRGSDAAEMKAYYSDNGAADFNHMDGYPQANFSLNEITKTRMPIVSRILEKWTLFEDANIFTQVLPARYTDNLTFGEDRIIFLPTIAKRTAERARPTTVESKRTSIRDVLERTAIGMELNYAMLTTPEGKEIYEMGLAQMRSAVEEANALEILNELMTCFSPWRNFEKRYGKYRGRSLKDILEDEKFYFGLFQREAGAFQLLDNHITPLQKVYRGRGNTYVMHRKLLYYNTSVPEANIRYWLGGPDAIARFNKSAENVTTDGRGNVIVTVETYMVENMKPLDPLKRFVTYGEYNDWRDIKRGGNYANHYDQERSIGIYNVDDDSWSLIDTNYVIDNCCRFHPKTGEPLGMSDSSVARHEVNYESRHMKDSYHYITKNSRGESVLLPCRYMGQINTEHITLVDIQKFADVAIEKMADLNKTYTVGLIKTIVDNGQEVLRYIESLSYNKVADDFIKAARDQNKNRAIHRGGGVSAFGTSFTTEQWGQNAHSGWDLPKRSDGASLSWEGVMVAPIGYGSAAGFLTIAAAYKEAGSSERFTQQYGFSAEYAQKISAYIDLLQEYVTYCKEYFPMCPALEQTCAAPWWHRPTALHTLWDSVLVSQHRLPFHVDTGDNDFVQGKNKSSHQSAQKLVEVMVGKSQNAKNVLSDTLLGRLNTLENIENSSREPPAAGSSAASLIGATIQSKTGGEKRVAFDKYQRRKEAIAPTELLATLPVFAQVRYTGYDPAGENPETTKFGSSNLLGNVRLYDFGEDLSTKPGNTNPEYQAVMTAYDTLVSLIFNTAQDVTLSDKRTKVETIVNRETSRALILSAMTSVKREDVKSNKSLKAQSILANRIISLYDMLVQKFVKKEQMVRAYSESEGAGERLLDGFEQATFINNFRKQAIDALDGSAPNPFSFTTDLEIDKTVQYLKSMVASQQQIQEELKGMEKQFRTAFDPANTKAARYNPDDYIPSPLVYSPQQLESHFFYVSGDKDSSRVPIALPASTDTPYMAMDLITESRQARAIQHVLQNPTESNLKNLDPALMPTSIGVGSPVHQNALLAHMNRARRYSKEKERARTTAAQERVGAPSTTPGGFKIPSERDVKMSDASSDMAMLDPSLLATSRRSSTLGKRGRAAPDEDGSEMVGEQRRSIQSTTFSGASNARRQESAARSLDESMNKRFKIFGGVDSSLPEMFLTKNFIENWNSVDANASKGLLNNWTSKIYLMTPFNAKVLKGWSAKDLLVPIRALLFRFAVLGTYSIIKVQAGAETGNLWISNSIFTWVNDGLNQVYYSQYDYYVKAKVAELANVFHADNVFIDEYLGGFGDIPVGWSDHRPVWNAGEANIRGPSVYVSLEPYNGRTRYGSVMSITGLQRDAFGKYQMEISGAGELDYDNACYFNILYGSQEAVNHERVSEASIAENTNFEPGSSPVLVFAGATKYWSAMTGDWTSTTDSAGYFPTSWYGKGLKDCLSGKMMEAPNVVHDIMVK